MILILICFSFLSSRYDEASLSTADVAIFVLTEFEFLIFPIPFQDYFSFALFQSTILKECLQIKHG